MADVMKATIDDMLKIISYDLEDLNTLEEYVEIQARKNIYDLEANLAVLKLYQFNAPKLKKSVVGLILLKALTNLPHNDFVLCKCLIDQQLLESEEIASIVSLHNLLETCQFKEFWTMMKDGTVSVSKIVAGLTGFEDSIRKFICHVVNITYQHIKKETLSAFLGNLQDLTLRSWMNKYGWKETENRLIVIGNQKENSTTNSIIETIDFENLTLSNSMNKYGWKETENRLIFIENQKENSKTNSINEKIDFEKDDSTKFMDIFKKIKLCYFDDNTSKDGELIKVGEDISQDVEKHTITLGYLDDSEIMINIHEEGELDYKVIQFVERNIAELLDNKEWKFFAKKNPRLVCRYLEAVVMKRWGKDN